MSWFPHERRTVLQALPLPAGSVTTLTNIFPLDGTGYYRIRLVLRGTVAAIVAPWAEGMYRWIKGVTLKTARGEVLYNNVPGMALYFLNAFLDHHTPQHDKLLAAGAATVAVLDLPLAMPFLARPEDTVLDSGRYSNLELQITTGTLADLSAAAAVDWTAPPTLDVEIIETLSALTADGKSKPYAHPYVTTYPLIHANVQTFWNLESSPDLVLFGFFIANHDATGIPFCEAAAGSDTLENVVFQDNVRTWINNQRQASFRNDRHELCPYDWYGITTVATEIPTGLVGKYPYFFVKNGSFKEVYPTKKQSQIRLSFTNPTGTDEADLCVFGMRALR